MAESYTIKNLTEVEDSAVKFGFGEIGSARFASGDVEAEQTGLSLHSVRAGKRQAFGHKHEEVEEIYFVVSGSGRVKLDDAIEEVGERDAIRVGPGVIRAFEAGEDGLEVLAFSPRRPDDRGEMLPGWWDD